MRFDSCDLILQDFLFFKNIISNLDDAYFPYMTRDEVQEEKWLLLEECKMDYAFKMLTLLEADIRQDFNMTIASKYRDPLSRTFSELCDQFRQGRSRYSQSRVEECRRVSLDEVFTTISKFFKNKRDFFHQRCSNVKGHFSVFRHWYAHGRYFRPKPPIIPDPEDLFYIHEEFVEKVLNRNRRA